MEIKIRISDTYLSQREKRPGREIPESAREGASRSQAPKLKNEAEKPDFLSIFDELEELIGLQEVKALIYEIQAFTEIQKLRAQNELAAEPTVLHAIFKGNPGSGKTTIARLLARLYREMGILEKGHLVEVERADLVGEFIGHTAQKTREQVKKAIGGVLFIDEAYSLCRGGEKDFGREAIDALVKSMEDHKNDFILILAGYNNEMNDFIRSNPGLNSRFPLHIQFPDYSLEELLDIAELMYSQRQYKLGAEAKTQLESSLRHILHTASKNHGNARTVRNIVEASLRCQAVRLFQQKQAEYSRDELSVITAWDIHRGVAKTLTALKSLEEPPLYTREQLREELQQLVR